jgi:PhnB protein
VSDASNRSETGAEAGATSVTEMTNLFFGDRVGRVRDPQGNLWWTQTRLEDVDPEEQTFDDVTRRVQESLDRELSGRSHR